MTVVAAVSGGPDSVALLRGLAAVRLQGNGQLIQGALESSNVNVVEELITMIQTQRAYELNSKVIQTADQMLAELERQNPDDPVLQQGL